MKWKLPLLNKKTINTKWKLIKPQIYIKNDNEKYFLNILKSFIYKFVQNLFSPYIDSEWCFG